MKLLFARCLIVGCGVLVIALSSVHAEARSLDDILKAGELRVGVNPTMPPLAEFNDHNEIDGFEPELAKAVADKLGVKLRLVQLGAPDRIPFVAADKIDVVMGAMSRTAERAKVIDFTVPIHSENYGILSLAGKPFSNLASLNDQRVTLVQVRGTTAVPYIQKYLPRAKLVLLDNYEDLDRALAQGRGDASFDAIDGLALRLKSRPSIKWKITAAPEFGVTYSCLGVAKGNYGLRDWLNVALYELHTSGTVEQLWEKWFLKPMDTKVPVTPYF